MRFLAFICCLACAAQGYGQSYPSRPVRMVVPLSPGGFADVPGRMFASRLSASLGHNVFVETAPARAA